jgi:hypothetical protein
MKVCIDCIEAKAIPTCVDLLTVGVIGANTEVTVYIENHATGYTTSQDVTSDVNGLVVIDMKKPYPDFYTENFYYTLWITEKGAPIEEPESFIINVDVYTCLTLLFKRVFEDNQLKNFDTYVITV